MKCLLAVLLVLSAVLNVGLYGRCLDLEAAVAIYHAYFVEQGASNPEPRVGGPQSNCPMCEIPKLEVPIPMLEGSI